MSTGVEPYVQPCQLCGEPWNCLHAKVYYIDRLHVTGSDTRIEIESACVDCRSRVRASLDARLIPRPLPTPPRADDEKEGR